VSDINLLSLSKGQLGLLLI